MMNSPFDSHDQQQQDEAGLNLQKGRQNELPQIPDKPTKATIGMGEGGSTVERGADTGTLNAFSSRPSQQSGGREQRRFTVPEIIMRR